MASLKRIRKELASLAESTWMPPGCRAGPVGDDLSEWQASMPGPPGSPYEGGTFFLRIRFPEKYPLRPLRMNFTTRVYHPGVSEHGAISLHVLRDGWTPALTVDRLLLAVYMLFTDPNVDEPLVPSIAHVCRTDRALYDATARAWTRKHAM